MPAKGISIHIGLNRVDPAAYNGWDGALSGCINDATDMKALAETLGYRATMMTDDEATADNVIAAIGQASNQLGPQDILFLTYSGHGGQVDDVAGDEDDGKDEPHLMKIIDWVYANLNGAGKFNIKSMWVGGHSWGGGYTARFGCKPELADKVKGLIMMSGGSISGFSGAACASKVAVIMTTAEGDGSMPGDQTMLATTHGCDAGQSQMILNNVHSFWAGCDPGFVHANYYMIGKEHATSMDKAVVESIVNWIKLQRQ